MFWLNLKLSLVTGLLVLLAGLALAQPSAPTGLTVTPNEEVAGVNLRWDPVPGAVGYEVLQWRNGKWWFNDEDPSRTPLTSSTTIGNLEPNTEYRFSVRAVGGEGEAGALSEAVEASTRPREVTVRPTQPDAPVPNGSTTMVDPKLPAPDAPTGLFAFFTSQDEIKLTWRASRLADRYYVEEELQGQWAPVKPEVQVRSANEVMIKNHPTPGPYRFRVRAVGKNGKSSTPSFPVTARRD
ncbi:MAG: fibronectin type III domain-containing protein [Vulcanimicrobiota bacterium]